MKRQKIRRAIIIISLLLFPVTLNYFSPYVSIDGAIIGVISGSLLLFAFMFLLSIFFGRAWCSWVCPMAGISDISTLVNDKNPNVKKLKVIRYIIFTIWALVLISMFILAGGIKGINPIHLTENIISVDSPAKYIIYYSVLLIFIILTFTLGKRGACHSICWMSPFLVAGFTIGKFLRLPQLRIKSSVSKCVECGSCNKKCPMSIDVKTDLKQGFIKTSDCILCGECLDSCNKKVFSYGFKIIKKANL